MTPADQPAFAAVVRHLDSSGVACVLIGAHAVALHGAPRATFDTDLLVTDERVLASSFWRPLADAGIHVEVRVGDPDDPLRGVVRCGDADAPDVDVIVPRAAWATAIVDRAVAADLRGVAVRVAAPADLILLKVWAGGPADEIDVRALLATPGGAAMRATVDERIVRLPRAARALWRRIRIA